MVINYEIIKKITHFLRLIHKEKKPDINSTYLISY